MYTHSHSPSFSTETMSNMELGSGLLVHISYYYYHITKLSNPYYLAFRPCYYTTTTIPESASLILDNLLHLESNDMFSLDRRRREQQKSILLMA